jgi:pyrroloquinoline-quinone synthase
MDRLIRQVLEDTRYRENPYFTALRTHQFDKEDFVETQIHFYSAVIFFNRPMAALAAKIPSPELRIEILRNVWEEHGEGDPAKVHGATFSEFLRRLAGVTPEDIQRRALCPEVRIFNTMLAGACVLDEYLIGTAVLGIIERMFVDISSWIGTGVIENGWLTRDKMIHYNVHEHLDVKHSEDFFAVLKPGWESSSENRYYIEQGLRSGAMVFNNMYEDLYRNRKRRALRSQ